MKYTVQLTIKAVTVTADSEDDAIAAAWSKVADEPSKMVKARIIAVRDGKRFAGSL